MDPSKPARSHTCNLKRLPSRFLVGGLIAFSLALAGCTTTRPRTPPAAVSAAQGDDQPEPLDPGIKPLTVEQEEQVGG